MRKDLDVKSREEKQEKEKLTAGQDFVRMIGPFGSALFLLMFILFLIFAFTGGRVG